MRPEWIAALDVGIAVLLQISVAKRKNSGTLETWIPWKSAIIGLHLSGLTLLSISLPGKSLGWLACLLLAASLSYFAYFAFAVLRNGPAHRRQQALLQKHQTQRESQILKDSQILKRFR